MKKRGARQVDPLANLKAEHIESLGLEAAYAEAEADLVPLQEENSAPIKRPTPPKPAAPRSHQKAKPPTEAQIIAIVETPIVVADALIIPPPEDAAPGVAGETGGAHAEMPSVAPEVAADIMPPSRRNTAVVEFDFF